MTKKLVALIHMELSVGVYDDIDLLKILLYLGDIRLKIIDTVTQLWKNELHEGR